MLFPPPPPLTGTEQREAGEFTTALPFSLLSGLQIPMSKQTAILLRG